MRVRKAIWYVPILSAVRTSRSSLFTALGRKPAKVVSRAERQRNTPMTISIVRLRSSEESTSRSAECSSSTAYADSRSTRSRIVNAAARAGDAGIALAEPFARNGAVSDDEIARGDRLLAFRLDLKQFQNRVCAAADEKFAIVDLHLGHRQVRGNLTWVCCDDLQVFPPKPSVGPGPGLKAAQAVANVRGGPAEIHQPIFFLEDR